MASLVEYTCIECGVQKKAGRHSSSLLYCSNACQQEYQYKKYIEGWILGDTSGTSDKTMAVSGYIRRWLFRKSNGCCEKCGWRTINPTTGKVPLQVNHIDGNWKNCRPENLELICPNCHSLTPNYGALNKGKGRKERKRNTLS